MLAVVILVTAVAQGGDIHPLILTSTVVAVLAAVVHTVWLPATGMKRMVSTVPVVCLVSLGVTAVYRGPVDNATALWILLETFALLVIIVPSVRHPGPLVATVVSLAMTATVTVLPLRIALTIEPPAGTRETLGLCVIWGVAAAIAVGASCYLRSLDSHRRIAVAAERRAGRLAIARDLHDFAAHDVTGVMVLSQAAQTLARSSPERALALLPQIETAGVNALEAMDRTIRILRDLDGDEKLPRPAGAREPGAAPREETGRALTLEEVPTLIERFNRTGTIPTRLHMAPGTLDTVPNRVGSVGYRVVLEALTNVRRHAPSASGVTVTIARRSSGTAGDGGSGTEVLRVHVVDDGDGAEDDPAAAQAEREGGGTGIEALEQRVRELDGRLTAEPAHPVGWQVTADFPLAAGPGGG
ncbi:sensor histidine kinase [Streptomyces sp. NPDC057552]|uniref:sensor histidine kinase n=1 Tax=Streptomyces sp. NPDC057552 TaxID=3350537 RepID=UPI0036855D06